MSLQNLLSYSPICENLYSYLSFEDAIRLRYLLPKDVDCLVPIDDPDSQLRFLKGVNKQSIRIYKSIRKYGSIETLINAARFGDVATIKYLIQQGLNVDIRDKNEDSALLRAIISYSSDRKAVVKYLLEAGTDINQVDNDGNSVLMLAILFCHEIVKLLLTFKPNLNIQNKLGRTALMNAAMRGLDQVVKLLVESGANLDQQHFSRGYTALIEAVSYRHTHIVRYLFEKGANPNLQNVEGKTALMIAFEQIRPNIWQLLTSLGVK